MASSDFMVYGEQFLHCPICLCTFKDPRVLDCLHSFCLKCIDNISHVRYGHVRCPICNRATNLAKKDPSYLPVNFYVNNIIDFLALQLNAAEQIQCSNCEVQSGCATRCMTCGDYLCRQCSDAHQRTRLTRGHTVVPLTELQDSETEQITDRFHRPLTCNDHQNEPLKYFCCLCEIAVCRDCLVKDHIQHACATFEDVWQKYRSEIATLVNQTKQKIKPLDQAAGNIKQTLELTQRNADVARNNVRANIKNCVAKIYEYGDNLIEKVNRMERDKMKVLKIQLNDVQAMLETVTSGCHFTENVLKYGNEAETLMITKQMKQRLRELQSYALDIELKEQAVIDYKFNEKKFEECLRPDFIGDVVTSNVYPNLCVLDQNGLKRVKVGRECNLTLNTVTRKGLLHHVGGESVEAKLTDRLDNKLNVSVKDKGDGSYFVNFIPVSKGHHVLEISLRGYAIKDSPFEFFVGTSFDYETLGREQKQFGGTGYGQGEFRLPVGIAVNSLENRVYIADCNNHRVQVFDKMGKFLFAFGQEGSSPGQMRFPKAIAVSSDNKIYISDNGNNRIQVFSEDGTYLQLVGQHGRGEGSMLGPIGIAVVGEYLVVAEEGNHRLQVYSRQNGSHVRFIGRQTESEQLFHPHHIAVNSRKELIVTDSINDKVHIFTLIGEHLLSFGRPGEMGHELNGPEGLCVDDEDNILVTDYHNNQIKVFDRKGNIHYVIGPKVLRQDSFNNPSGIITMSEGVVFLVESGNNLVRILS